MIETILSMLGGGAMRIVPELIGLWNKKSDNEHELKMLVAQTELAKTNAVANQAAIESQGQIDVSIAMLAAQKEALSGQMQQTNLWWVDALNTLVRPLTTYYFLLLYGLHKLGTMIMAVQGEAKLQSLLNTWTPDDAAILAAILSFWFVGRVFDKQK